MRPVWALVWLLALAGCGADGAGDGPLDARDAVAPPDAAVGDVAPDALAPADGPAAPDLPAPPGDAPSAPDGAPDGAADVPADVPPDAGPGEPPRVPGTEVPPRPAAALGFPPPARTPAGEPVTPEEVTAFTRRLMAFFAETRYFDWVYRMTHGLDASYVPPDGSGAADGSGGAGGAMLPYRLWWQDVSVRREGDTLVFTHRRYAENITKRTVKVLDGAASGYLLTGDPRMAALAADLLRGVVALSVGFENRREDPLVKYLQARAIFTHDHAYEVDGRRVRVDYGPAREAGFKWNVASFEIPDNPMYGSLWVANMRSKDDVPYLFHAVDVATRVYYAAEDEDLRAAARLFVEYQRGFAQRIVDDDWFIRTRYEDGLATIQVDRTKEGAPPADLGSFVHWQALFGPDAECTAQLGAALAGYGYPAGKGDCGRGLVGRDFERLATTGNWFNHNIYNYFHIAALTGAQLWGQEDRAAALMDGLVERFETIAFDPRVPNGDHKEYASDLAGWLVSAASRGYPLTAREARHVMHWYGESADWYRGWEHWDPWASLPDGGELGSWEAPRDRVVPDGEGGERTAAMVRLTELPYVFEYCASPLKAETGVRFVDCEVVADPTQWMGE
jgi:hypothetical protein